MVRNIVANSKLDVKRTQDVTKRSFPYEGRDVETRYYKRSVVHSR
jgi:hypothetical protein